MAHRREEWPAILGGMPVRPQGPPDWPLPDAEVAEALQRAYRDGSWGKYDGGQVLRLEEALAAFHQVPYVLTCGSGTFAVELALRALRLGAGDEVLLAGYDYVGNFLSIHAVGARPVLVDVHPDNWNLDVARLAEAVSPATRAVLVSHLHGGVVPMPAVCAFAAAHGLAVIEDAAQCPGAWIAGRRAGTWGDAGILSFGGSKLLTAGRGGALLTRRPEVYQRARILLQRGNQLCPLSELQAAVLLPQLARLEERNQYRLQQVAYLARQLERQQALRLFRNSLPDVQPGYYKVGFQWQESVCGLSRELFLAAVQAEGVAFAAGFPALHHGRAPSRFRAGTSLTQAEHAHAGAVVLHHPVLLGSRQDLEEVVRAVDKVVRHAEQLRAQGPLAQGEEDGSPAQST
jgi:perosamine synthetase